MKLQNLLALALLAAASCPPLSAPAQTAKTTAPDHQWQPGGAFEGYSPQQEVPERRTRYAKHFRNPDGTFTMQTGRAYHYRDEAGAWQDIDLRLTGVHKDGIGFGNYTNDVKSAFPELPGRQAIDLVTPEHTLFNWWGNPQIVLRTDRTSPGLPQLPKNVRATVRNNQLTYPMLYDGISEEFVVMINGIEHNTIIHRLAPALAALPAGGLVTFRQFIPAKPGWKIEADGAVKQSDFTARDFHITVPGIETGVSFSPIVAFDGTLTREDALYLQYAPEDKLSPAEAARKQQHVLACNYEVAFVPDGMLVSYLVPAGWLQQPGRAFPVTVDPTVTFTPSPLYSGGYFYAPMSHWYGYQRHADLYLASELGISNVNITNIEYQRMNTTGTNAVRPAKVYMRTTAATTLGGTDAWNSTTYTGGLTPLYNDSADFHGTTTGWKMITLSTPFLYAADNLLVMVYDQYRGTGSAKYLNMSDAFGSNRQAYKRQDNTDPGDASATAVEAKLAEIRLTYTPAVTTAPSCIAAPLAPLNAATGICSGTTVLRWNKAASATGYDVYFNTGSTATTQVASNQADTFFNATTAVGSYAWRVVPRNSIGAATGCNTFTFTTIQGVLPAVSVSVAPNDTLCPRVPATFTAAPVNGGNAPGYQWKKNNVNVGTNSASYTDNNLANNDAITVVLTSNSTACLSTNTATSSALRMTILPAPASVITASGPTKFCFGGAVTLTAPSGATSYQWATSNGIIVGATGSTYVALYNDRYTVIGRSASGCDAVGDSIRVTVYQLPVPRLYRSGSTISTDAYYPVYQWYKGASPIAGATTNSYTYTTDGDYSVVVTDTNSCTGRSFVLPVYTTSVGQVTGSGYRVYPNPAGRLVSINAPGPVNVTLRGIDGRLVLERRSVTTFDISALADGMYMLYLTDEQGRLVGVDKLIKSGR